MIDPTKKLAHWVARADRKKFSGQSMTCARQALLDWVGVTIAGCRAEPVDILTADVLNEGGGGVRLVGRHETVPASSAALINAVASHVLDYDDINKHMRGHPSVTIIPAVLAAAEPINADGQSILKALVVGVEVAATVGRMMGPVHYQDGWHTTATVGTLGAAAAVSHLLELDAAKTEMALAIAATQAAGLKSMFGTMSKPLHAGKAAMNGLYAARWAKAGFTGAQDVLECQQGFGPVMSRDFKAIDVRSDPAAPFAIEHNIYKYHAACYYTHSVIEAASALIMQYRLSPCNILGIRVAIPAAHLNVCNIQEPKTGLAIKFSICHLVAMVAAGLDTSDPEVFTNNLAKRADLVEFAQKIEVSGENFESRTAGSVRFDLTDGRSVSDTLDVGIPQSDLDLQWQLLTHKFNRLATPSLGSQKTAQAIQLIKSFDQTNKIKPLMDVLTTTDIQ